MKTLILIACGWMLAAGSAAAGISIVFDSNRSGTFGIYRVQLDGSGLQTVADARGHEMFPDPSPDYQWIAYARAASLEEDAPSSIRRCRPDGSEDQLVVKNGTFPTFSRDGKRIYFERNRDSLMAVSLEGGDAQQLLPRPGWELEDHVVAKPTVSPDGRFAALITDMPSRWHTWIVDLRDGTMQMVGEGCEPRWHANGQSVVWVGARLKDRCGISQYNVESKRSTVLQDADRPWGHEYFPWISRDGKYLLWGACQWWQHSHDDSNYQIFWRDLSTGAVHRVTHDEFTNRWPKGLRTE